MNFTRALILFAFTTSFAIGADRTPIIQCAVDGQRDAVTIYKNPKDSLREFSIVLKHGESLRKFYPCLNTYEAEYDTFAYSPYYGNFIGWTHPTSMGRGVNRSRMTATHYEDTKSVVLKCDYSADMYNPGAFSEYQRITFYGCNTF